MFQPKRILVADGSKYFASSIWQMLIPEPEFEIVGLACNAEEAINMATTLFPDIILVDLSHSDMRGLRTIQTLNALHPGSSIITFMPISFHEYTQAALDAGAAACLPKSEMANVLVQTLRDLIPVQSSIGADL
jgi:DNA-binding NarL/FixJ family response regulator